MWNLSTFTESVFKTGLKTVYAKYPTCKDGWKTIDIEADRVKSNDFVLKLIAGKPKVEEVYAKPKLFQPPTTLEENKQDELSDTANIDITGTGTIKTNLI